MQESRRRITRLQRARRRPRPRNEVRFGFERNWFGRRASNTDRIRWEDDLTNRFHAGQAAVAVLTAFLMASLVACNRNGGGGDVMASVNGRRILRSEVDKYYAGQT